MSVKQPKMKYVFNTGAYVRSLSYIKGDVNSGIKQVLEKEKSWVFPKNKRDMSVKIGEDPIKSEKFNIFVSFQRRKSWTELACNIAFVSESLMSIN